MLSVLGKTAFLHALKFKEIVKLLLENGADPKDENGYTAIDLAKTSEEFSESRFLQKQREESEFKMW